MITAIMIIDQISVDAVSGWYNISANVYASDGISSGGAGAYLRLPLIDALAHRKVNRLLREDAAAKLFAIYGWTIDSEDIYVPLT